MRKIKLLILSLTLLTCQSVLAQESDLKAKLIGSWTYFGFEATSEVPPPSNAELEKAAKINKGIVIKIWKKVEGKKKVLASGTTQLKKGKHLTIEGLEGDIHTLNKNYLKLYAVDRPLMVFKRYID
jgi:hypothetical protein